MSNQDALSDKDNNKQQDVCAVPFSSPTTIGIFGATLCGKTTWCKKMIEQSHKLFTVPIKKILFCYGMHQDLLEKLDSDMENFYLHAGLPTIQDIEEFTSDKEHNMIVLDDLQQEMAKDAQMEKLFTQLAHHLNVTVVFMGNNLFYKNFSRTITVNLHVIILFRNARDAQQVRCLARQLYPLKTEQFINAYLDSTNQPYGYIVIDLSPSANNQLSLRSNIFVGEDPIIYKM